MLREEVIAFLKRYAAGEYGEEEHVLFLNWLNTAPLHEIEEGIEAYREIAENTSPGEKSHARRRSVDADLVAQIEAALNRVDSRPGRQSGGSFIKFGRWFMAAALVGGLSMAGYRLFFHQGRTDVSAPVPIALSDVPAPQHTKATLTLGDGRVVELQDSEEGMLGRQDGVEIIRKGKGGIVYKKVAVQPRADAPVSYNVLHNPKGSGVVALTLSDGTRAWLNAESSLRYPVEFGKERNVEITGEAYFEVAKDPQRKFMVSADGVTTEVLGTHFNMNTYKDEGETTVTLLEGSVVVRMDDGGVVPARLQPRQQARVTTGITVIKDVDTKSVVAWKDGMFMMRQTDIGTIMRQIGRWYNVEVKYEAGIPKGTISGEVSRELNLSEILKVLEYSGVQVKIENGKAIVMP